MNPMQYIIIEHYKMSLPTCLICGNQHEILFFIEALHLISTIFRNFSFFCNDGREHNTIFILIFVYSSVRLINMYWYQTHESNIVSYIGHKACLDPSAVDLLLFYILCGSKSYCGLLLQQEPFEGVPLGIRYLNYVAFTTLEAKHGAERWLSLNAFMKQKNANGAFGIMEFSKWNRNSLNSANLGNRINQWSMNWAQFKDPVSHTCLAGALTQEMAGWQL